MYTKHEKLAFFAFIKNLWENTYILFIKIKFYGMSWMI